MIVDREEHEKRAKPETLRGHLGLKSSAYAPTSSKFSTQSMVAAHFRAHYDKIAKVKSTIDNKAPKSSVDCPIVRDRIRREVAMGIREDTSARQPQVSEHRTRTKTSSFSTTHVHGSDRDVLNIQSHKFTEPSAFTPRTLKTKPNVQSRLVGMRCYRSGSAGPKVTQKTVSRPASSMDETLVSRDLNRQRDSSIPPLDISVDADNYKWLKEQAKNAQVRQKTVNRNAAVHTQSNLTQDELKYLDFVHEVTTDILDRGIYTNRMLNQVFESHIQKRKNELSVERMRAELQDLKLNLGIPDDTHHDEGFGHGSTLKRPPQPPPRSARTQSSVMTSVTNDTTAEWTSQTDDMLPTPTPRKNLNHITDYELHLENTEELYEDTD